MPVRFNCNECKTLLSVGRRKIGERIDCPKCGAKITVPIIDALTGRPVRPKTKGDRQLVSPSTIDDDPADDDPDAPIAEYVVRGDEVDPAANPGGIANGPPTGRGITMSVGGFLIQWCVIMLALVGAFFGGYWYHLFQQTESPPTTTTGDPLTQAVPGVIVEGAVVYEPSPGRVEPDVGSMVFLFPVEPVPETPLEGAALSPSTAIGAAYEAATADLEQIGGAAAKTDEEGKFLAATPASGDFYVLIVSSTTRRSGEIDSEDREEMAAYLDDPSAVIGDRRYFWDRISLPIPWALWEPHNFGPSGR